MNGGEGLQRRHGCVNAQWLSFFRIRRSVEAEVAEQAQAPLTAAAARKQILAAVVLSRSCENFPSCTLNPDAVCPIEIDAGIFALEVGFTFSPEGEL